jgi:peptide/nickel transport system permease protein
MNAASPSRVGLGPAGPSRPTIRARLARNPPSTGFLLGAGLLGLYLFAALSALVVFRNTLTIMPSNPAWVSGFTVIGPSWPHPFGVIAGFGTDLFDAVWQATPWDLSIVASILAIDVVLGLYLGTFAGLHEGGVVDAAVVFVGDSIGAIPSYLLLPIVFAGLGVIPGAVGLPTFVLVFGLALWPTMARAVRERARLVSHERYVEAARASGASPRHVLLRHILPNSIDPALAQIPIDVAPIFFLLSVYPWFSNCGIHGQSQVYFLTPGLGFASPLPSARFPEWGYLLGVGTCEGFSFPGGFDYWWMYVFPLLAILVLGFAIALVCDGIERWRRFDR